MTPTVGGGVVMGASPGLSAQETAGRRATHGVILQHRQRRRPMSASGARAVATVQIDDASVRVTEWRFAPGAATGWHRHEYAYVVVPLTTGRLAITGPGGTVTAADLVQGRSYTRDAGVEHDVRNDNAFEFVFV